MNKKKIKISTLLIEDFLVKFLCFDVDDVFLFSFTNSFESEQFISV